MTKPETNRVRAPRMPPKERRQQLLQAGITSIAEHGFGNTRHAGLAHACQISVPAVFSYFPNRAALVNAILDEVGGALITDVIDAAQAMNDPASRLEATATLYAQFAQHRPDYAKVWLMWGMHFAADLQQAYQQYESQVIKGLSEMIVMTGNEDYPEEDTLDRARIILASSAFLAKMVFDGVSEHRRNEFAHNVLQPMQIGSKQQENKNV